MGLYGLIFYYIILYYIILYYIILYYMVLYCIIWHHTAAFIGLLEVHMGFLELQKLDATASP